MEGFALEALDEAVRLGAAYADVRAITQRVETVETRDGALQLADEQQGSGFGVRVLISGAWGFAAHSRLEREAIGPTVRRAIEAARAAGRANPRPVELAAVTPAVAAHETPLARDPFAVPITEKGELLLAAERALHASPAITASRTHLIAFATEKVFCSSEGARITQHITECGAALWALATGEGTPAHRSFDNYGQAGWEFIEGLRLEEQAARVGEEAAGLLTAPYVEPGVSDVVLGSEQLALMVHETCGHPTELDRVLGFEDAFAGGSFLQPQDLGQLRYGSEHVTMSADSTLPEGLGTFGYDDDGVPAQRFLLVDRGIFSGYLSSRDTAPLIGWEYSTGCSRADGWGRVPIVRMVNVSLEPGSGTCEDLIGGVEDGLYLDTPASWSLDDKRLNFHFGLELGREIKNGRLGGLRRGATIQNLTPAFWGSCDGVAGPENWRLWGFLSCAKGEPLQSLHVGHGAAPARFRQIPVGVER